MIKDETVAKVVQMARALADPTRVKMLGLLQAGRECCELSCCGLPAPIERQAICNCELKEILGIPQANVSYHIKTLREAGLVKEHPVGKWTYVALKAETEGILNALSGACHSEEETTNE